MTSSASIPVRHGAAGTPAANGRAAYAHLDGMRGLLVLAVVFTHIFYLSQANLGGSLHWYQRMTLVFQPVMCAVGLFLFISGFCLMLPVARSPLGLLPGGRKGYFRRRVRRILPPYYAALVLSIAHVALFPGLYQRLGLNPVVGYAGVLWSHLLLVHNLNSDWSFQVSAPLWSMASEWQMYLLFAVALLPLWRRFGMRALLLLSVAATLALMLLGPAVCRMHPWYLLLFVLGMATACHVMPGPRSLRLPWRGIAMSLAGLFTLEWVALALTRPQVFGYLPLAWQQYCFNELTLGLAFAAMLLHWHRAAAQMEQRAEAVEAVVPVLPLGMPMMPLGMRVLRAGPLMALGRISYSLYLVHWPVVVTVVSMLRALHLAPVPTLLIGDLIGLPLAVAAGSLFYQVLERRLLRSAVRARSLTREQPVWDLG